MPTVIETADSFRSQLARLETAATSDLLSAYRGVTNRLEDKITVLMARFEQLESQGRLTPENVRKLATWGSLLNQIEDEITKYGGYVDTQNRVAAQKSIDLAGKHSQLLTATYFNDNPQLLKAFNATWDRLPNESIETLLGFLQSDSQLSQNLNRTLGTSAAENFASKLIEGIALGYNPNKINSLINQSLSEPLTWSLNSVRTTQNYAYRESTRANYVNNSEILGGWKWYAALDGRVCLSCVNQHGREFPLNDRLNDHHQGRCTQIPILDRPERFGLKPLEIEQGEKWFNKLSKTEQVERMGIDRYAAYKAGKFKFSDLSQKYQNDTFGEMLKEASLKTLLSKASKSKPKKPVQPPTNLKSTADVFRLDSSLDKRLTQASKEALALIDQVHQFPKNADRIPVSELSDARKGVQGQYNVANRTIELSEKAFLPKETLIHEIGHFIDYALIGNDFTAVETSKKLDQWRNAVSNSTAYKTLVDMSFNPDKYTRDYGLAGKVKPDVQYTSYLMQLDECFARSYAQYILTKVGKDSLFDETRQDQLYGSKQWDSKDFEPILKAFDKLFEGLQWKQ
jgi:hypothetical protein